MRRYLIALLISAAIIAALFILLEVMLLRMQFYLAHDGDIPLWERILFSIARLWGRFWPELSYFFVTTSLAVAGLVHFIQFMESRSNKAGRS